MTADLFESVPDVRPSREAMAEGAVLLRGFARPVEAELIADIGAIVAQAPFRHMVTPGGHQMSVAMTNCGSAGWVTDRSGYRYDGVDPESRAPWPAMPASFRALAAQAAAEAGFDGFAPDACLINRYRPAPACRCIRTRMRTILARRSSRSRWACRRSSCSAACSAATRPRRFRLEHGDVVVWGGPSRLFFHGVAPLADGEHALLGRQRINLTFRKAR